MSLVQLPDVVLIKDEDSDANDSLEEGAFTIAALHLKNGFFSIMQIAALDL